MKYDCLIIDDEKELADNTCEYFNMFEVPSYVVYSKAAALEFLKDNTPSLILLDINLSDGSGFELCKHIRQTLEVPILFISARNTDDDKIIALNIGGDDYIEKPYSLGVILAKVKVMLKRFGNTVETVKPDVFEDGKLKLETNRCGGILGGISVGGDVAPIIFDCAVKPTPTIGKEQRTVDLETRENTTLKAHGRHDPCIVPRAVPVFEAAAALAIADLI